MGSLSCLCFLGAFHLLCPLLKCCCFFTLIFDIQLVKNQKTLSDKAKYTRLEGHIM